ncbi:MAG: VWA domain-containing protein [Clostridiales bacterium]|nr:VWA domain-containing protein [Clostridiales bacterium]
MFVAFFYLLRQRGLDVSLSEWLTLLEAMEKGLHHSSLTGFYHLCRALIIKGESEFDRFDQVFLEFFKDVPFHGELPQELMDWLNHPSEDLMRSLEELRSQGFPDETLEELLKMLEERLREQDAEHNGGNHWIGTQGRSPFGNSGWHPNGIRIGGQSRWRTAMSVAGERKYRDFRKDNTLDTRQFQMAFRLLRQMSVQTNSRERELDLDETIQDTCDNGGILKVRYKKPRKNAIKLLLLMDSGGSMDYYSELCGMLFQAATKSRHFKELHTYYFHNCVDDDLFTHPSLGWENAVPLDWVLANFDSSYKVILVGDAAMNPYELKEKRYEWGTGNYHSSGLECLEKLKNHFPAIIWLNPEPAPARPDFWTQTHWFLMQMFAMYDLSAEGLEKGIRRLMAPLDGKRHS